MSTVAIVPTVTGTPASTIGAPLSMLSEEPLAQLLLVEPLPPEVVPPELPLEMPLLEGSALPAPLALLLEALLEPPSVPLSSEAPANPLLYVGGLEHARMKIAGNAAATNERTVFICVLQGFSRDGGRGNRTSRSRILFTDVARRVPWPCRCYGVKDPCSRLLRYCCSLDRRNTVFQSVMWSSRKARGSAQLRTKSCSGCARPCTRAPHARIRSVGQNMSTSGQPNAVPPPRRTRVSVRAPTRINGPRRYGSARA